MCFSLEYASLCSLGDWFETRFAGRQVISGRGSFSGQYTFELKVASMFLKSK